MGFSMSGTEIRFLGTPTPPACHVPSTAEVELTVEGCPPLVGREMEMELEMELPIPRKYRRPVKKRLKKKLEKKLKLKSKQKVRCTGYSHTEDTITLEMEAIPH